ncbi:MAG: LAGLIDADG family homing endonuclease [Candidatus Woesebacteria bacterium]|nr:LAGLIDADG family homing endonuclease [Candidatus Woesebacteria bacterium]
MKIKNYKNLLDKVEEVTKQKELDLSSGEDLSIGIMNLISIEEHLFFTSQKTKDKKYLDILDEVRLMRTDLLKEIIKDYEGEVWCLPPQTIIFGDPNPKPISSFKVDEKVFSHDGKFSIVKKIFKRKYVGDLININPYYGNSLSMTPEHEVLCATNVRGKQKDLWRKNFKVPEIVWKKAKDMNSSDFLLFPRYQIIEDLKKIDIEYSWTNNGCYKPTTFKQEKMVPVNDRLLKLIGVYLAEGSTNGKNNLYFSFGKYETKFITETAKLFKSIFKEELKVSETRTTIDLVCSKRIIVKFFNQFGHRSKEKELPLWLINLPNDKLIHLIWGLVKGDGFIDKYQISYFTSSEKLVYQLRFLLYKIGILHSLKKTVTQGGEIEGRKINPSSGYTINFSGDAARILNDKIGLKYKVSKTSGNLGYVLDDYVMIPIRKIEKVKYSGFVYNLHTEANTYTTFTGVVHNCISKHLLSASMRLMEVGTKELKKHDKEKAWKMFEKSYKLYSLFWGLNLGIVGKSDIKQEKIKASDSIFDKLGTLVQKAIDCCKE